LQYKPVYFCVGDCLYRSNRTDVYRVIFQCDGRQVKSSLKTTDPELASADARYIAKKLGAGDQWQRQTPAVCRIRHQDKRIDRVLPLV